MDSVKRIPNLFIEDAEMLPGGFRNFEGRGSKYNQEGNRNFNIAISDEEYAQRLIDEGWNVRLLKPRDEDESPRYKLNVTVSFRELRGLPPTRVFLYSGRKKTLLDAESINVLDYAEYRTADLTIRPRLWTDEKTGERRIKAYLQEMHVTIEEDPWRSKYADYDRPVGAEE